LKVAQDAKKKRINYKFGVFCRLVDHFSCSENIIQGIVGQGGCNVRKKYKETHAKSVVDIDNTTTVTAYSAIKRAIHFQN